MDVFRSESESDSYVYGLSEYTTALVTLFVWIDESIMGNKLCT